MATHVSSRPKQAPQLPPFRPFSFYPTHVANLSLTGVDTTPITADSSKRRSSFQKVNLDRPLPSPPALQLLAHRNPAMTALQQQSRSDSPARSHRTSTSVSDTTSRLSPPPPVASQRTDSSNFFSRSNVTPLALALQEPNVLHVVLWQLEWADTYSLFTCCKRLSALFESIPLRDIILSRFVPEYAQCLRERGLRPCKDIPFSVFDLDLLLISQRVALHRYPIHSLKVQSSIIPSLEDDQTTEKLGALAQAHSRFVLLLQSVVHSSMASLPQETEEGTSRPRFSPIQTLRELTFPAPLAYTEPPVPPPKDDIALVTAPGKSGKVKFKYARHKSASTSSGKGSNSTRALTSWPSNLPSSPRPSADLTLSSSRLSPPTLKKKRTLSIFGLNKDYKMNLPPPPDEPRALRVYASTWRRTSVWGSYADISEDPGFSSPLKRPRRIQSQHSRQLRSSPLDSSSSSLSNHSPSPLSQSRSRNSIVMSPEARTTSPHDLILATSRVRAPILRVFVPCTKLELDSDSLVKCEQQLVESGLWGHLSTGDIVCNLGYVPPLEDSSSSDGEDPSARGSGEFIMMRPGASSGLANGGSPNGAAAAVGNAQKWLLYNGHMLVPYTPPDLLPLDQPLNLPTPFYYAHIMPPYTNLSYIINQLPVCDDVPQLTLVTGTKKVKSPHSPNGYAMVKKYSWIARIVRMRTEADGEMGEGWFGEWVLEGEGTPEGKLLLINALKGYNLGHREWELVREKSGGGKLWLRLLTIC